MSELTNVQVDIQQTYETVKNSLVNAQKHVYTAVNHAMVQAYWEIGEQIYKACGENDRAGYGKKLLQYLSDKLSDEFGRGFSIQNLRRMRQFYLVFPNRSTLLSELGWSHYLHLMKIEDKSRRDFYAEECVKSAWSVRQLERQIYASKYKLYMPTEEEFKKELKLDDFEQLSND